MRRTVPLCFLALLAFTATGCEYTPPTPWDYDFSSGFLESAKSVLKFCLASLAWLMLGFGALAFVIGVCTVSSDPEAGGAIGGGLMIAAMGFGLTQLCPAPTVAGKAGTVDSSPKSKEKEELDGWRGRVAAITAKRADLEKFLATRTAELQTLDAKIGDAKSTESQQIQRKTLADQVAATTAIMAACDDVIENAMPLVDAIRSSIEADSVGVKSSRTELWEKLRKYQSRIDGITSGNLSTAK